MIIKNLFVFPRLDIKTMIQGKSQQNGQARLTIWRIRTSKFMTTSLVALRNESAASVCRQFETGCRNEKQTSYKDVEFE